METMYSLPHISLRKSHFAPLAFVGSLFVATLPSVNTASAAPVIGTSSAVRGEVLVTTGGAQRKAKVRGSIRLQDRVATRDDSALQILLLDRTTFTVGQNCSMVIDKFVYDPGTTSGKVSAKVTKGAFRFMSGNIGKSNPTNASVKTPSATIGIRGTFFEGVVGEDAVALGQLGGMQACTGDTDSASIIVLRGPGMGRNTLDQQGQITVDSGGRSVAIERPNFAVFTPCEGRAPIGPFKVTEEMQAYLNFFLRSEPNGPSENPIGLEGTGSKQSGQTLFETAVDDSETIPEPEDLPNEAIEDPLVGEDDNECYYGYSAGSGVAKVFDPCSS